MSKSELYPPPLAAGRKSSQTGNMFALSVKQPWASLLVHGLKTIEVRRWPTARRGRRRGARLHRCARVPRCVVRAAWRPSLAPPPVAPPAHRHHPRRPRPPPPPRPLSPPPPPTPPPSPKRNHSDNPPSPPT